MSMTADRVDVPDFLLAFSAMHDAMRRDAGRLVRFNDDRPDPLPARTAKPLAQWWQRFERTIVHHHEREDSVIWPELVNRRPEFADARAPLEIDHHALDEAMLAVRNAVAGAAGGVDDPAVRRLVVREFATLLADHLAREESAAFPLIADAFTDEEFRVIEKQMSKQVSLGHIAFELPWVMDEADERVRALGKELLPAPVHLLNRLIFAPRYRRLTALLVAPPKSR
jgi:hemerythrin-like domain-containing protein